MLIVLLFGFSSGLPLALSGSTLAVWLTESNIDLGTIGLAGFVGFLAVTDGPEGVYWLDKGAVRHMEAFKVDAVDTLGAGYGTVAGNFEADLGAEPRLVYAVYSTPAYEGSPTVIFWRDGKWFEAGGGHCSCYGLEGQWDAKEIDPTEHLAAIKEGKKILLVADSEGDYPEATQENFDKWLKWAVGQSEKLKE